jgi:quercetin dioxygenase-like cupin family protein
MIFCLEGAIEVQLGSAAPITLRAGEMTFIPPATEHELRNRGSEPAVYIFVFSRAPEPAPEEKAHEH